MLYFARFTVLGTIFLSAFCGRGFHMIKIGLGLTRISFISLFFSVVTPCLAQSDSQQGIDIKELSQRFVEYIDNIHYFTDNELNIQIPGVNQEVCIPLGFSGSGDVFTPLPWVSIQLKHKNGQIDNAGGFSIAELGKVFVHDEVNRLAKNVEMFQWLFADKQLSPLKLFTLKLFLLSKDYLRNGLDITTVRSEFFRLLVRLCITENVGMTDPNKSLSEYLPGFIKEFLNDHFTEAVNVLDMVWGIVVGNKQIEDVTAMALNHPHMVYACTFNSQAAADLYFSTLQKTGGQRFINGPDVIPFSNVSGSGLPNGMPQELKDAACAVKQFPDFVKVKADDGRYWIGYVVNRFGAYQTAKLFIIALMQTIKKYIHAHREYFKAHPLEAQRYQQEQDAYYKQQRRIRLFLDSEDGKKSQSRLEKVFQKIEKQKTRETHYKGIQKNNHSVALGKEINALETSRDKAIEKLDRLNDSYKEDSNKRTYNDITATKKDIELLNNVIRAKEQELAHLEQTAESSEEDCSNEQKQLNELRELVKTLKTHGEKVPDEVINEIQALEKIVSPVNADKPLYDTQAMEQRLSMRDRMAQAYEQEAKNLETECNKKTKALEAISNQVRRNIEKLKFSAAVKPLYDAYIQELKTRSAVIRDENKKVKELVVCRKAYHAVGDTVDCSVDNNKDSIARYNVLETEVGWLVNNQETPGLMHMLMTNNPELKELFAALRSDGDCTYAEIKDYLYNALAVIIQQSDHIKDMAHTYRYAVQAIIPGFLPLFDKGVNVQAV
jgi:hypothetical protein